MIEIRQQNCKNQEREIFFSKKNFFSGWLLIFTGKIVFQKNISYIYLQNQFSMNEKKTINKYLYSSKKLFSWNEKNFLSSLQKLISKNQLLVFIRKIILCKYKKELLCYMKKNTFFKWKKNITFFKWKKNISSKNANSLEWKIFLNSFEKTNFFKWKTFLSPAKWELSQFYF